MEAWLHLEVLIQVLHCQLRGLELYKLLPVLLIDVAVDNVAQIPLRSVQALHDRCKTALRHVLYSGKGESMSAVCTTPSSEDDTRYQCNTSCKALLLRGLEAREAAGQTNSPGMISPASCADLWCFFAVQSRLDGSLPCLQPCPFSLVPAIPVVSVATKSPEVWTRRILSPPILDVTYL